MDPKLAALREELSGLDARLLSLLKERSLLVNAIGKAKKKLGKPIQDEALEAAILIRNRQWAEAEGLDPDFIEAITRIILSESRRLQNVIGNL